MQTTMSEVKISTAPLLDQLSLWPHQRDAVDRMRNYIAHFQEGDAKGSALVHMPTGGGKTGVMATLARCLPEVGFTLIMAPRVALREQICRDVHSRFFQHLNQAPAFCSIPKRVVELIGGSKFPEIKDHKSTILVTTIQKITSMSNNDSPDLADLAQYVSLIIVDEGHYEPAASWSLAIRNFNAPKIIFTATPYRNDLKIFDINLEHTFSYTYHEATEDKILREVEFQPRKPTKDPNEFIEDVISFYDDQFINHVGPKPRVIIRCDRIEEIRQICSALENHQRDYVAIHEGFSDNGDNPHERKTVPNPRDISATFWIHQFKLMEGIDDSRFQMLALFEPLRNARSLVQQIGRIIRNPGRRKSDKGFVLDHSGGRQWDLWLGFIKYDEALRAHGEDGLNLAIGQEWLLKLFRAQPICTYLTDQFRMPLDLDQLDPRQDLLLPRIVNIFEKGVDFDLEKMCDLVSKSFVEQDRLFRRYDEDFCIVYVYITFNNSPLLNDEFFLEPKLGVTLIREFRNLVAFFDSSGYLPIDFNQAGLENSVSPYDMKKLFSDHQASFLTGVSLRNSNLGTRSIRSRSFRAGVVRDTVSAFDDHAQICVNATGYSLEERVNQIPKRIRRYVGFHRGRISEAGQRGFLDDYEGWLNQVIGTLNQGRRLLTTFKRYAPEYVEAKNPTPLHILLDLFEVEENYVTIIGKRDPVGTPMEIEDLSRNITKGKFNLVANGMRCEVLIHYDEQKKRYILDSPELDRLYRNIDILDNRGLISYINQEQSFRIVPATENIIYTLGAFYKPLFKIGPNFDPKDLEVSKILVPSPQLEYISEEKGKVFPKNKSGWEENTLFGVIDRLGHSAGISANFRNPDILVCDDMGTESADFILANSSENRVVFIHAKASKNRRPYSASALQEVSAQAIKNINFLGLFNTETPPNLDRWDQAWPSDKKPKVAKRIRKGKGNGKETWEQIRALTRHPLTDREVWLFLGQTLSKSEFERRLKSNPPAPEAVQAAYLLHATLTNVASIGAKLRVFCYP